MRTKMAKGDVARKAARSQHKEQQIGDHRHLDELQKRLAQSEEARGQNVNQARWQAAVADIQPKTVGDKAAVESLGKPRDVEEHAPEAEVVPITEQPQKPGLMDQWVEAGKKVAAAATIAAALSPASIGNAAEVPVSERSHIRATQDTTKEVRGVVKRDGKMYVSKKGKRGAGVATLRPGDTIHVYEQTTIDDTGLRIINEEDYYGDWVLGDPDNPQARLHLGRTHKGKVEGHIIEPVKDKPGSHVQYAIRNGEFDTNTGKLHGYWEVSVYAIKTKQPQGGAQFLLQDDGTLLYGYRKSSHDNPSGRFTRPYRVIGPWTKEGSRGTTSGSSPISPGTSGYSPGPTSPTTWSGFPSTTGVSTPTSWSTEVDAMLGQNLSEGFYRNVNQAIDKMTTAIKDNPALEKDAVFWLKLGGLYGSVGCDYWGDGNCTPDELKLRVNSLACLNKALELDTKIGDSTLWGQPFREWYKGVRDTAIRHGGFIGDPNKLTVTVDGSSLKFGE
ncbi:MAG: hypothetical protein ABH834_03325 [Candidatus Altiarchaeota archaeon]